MRSNRRKRTRSLVVTRLRVLAIQPADEISRTGEGGVGGASPARTRGKEKEVMLVDTGLHPAGYKDDGIPAMQTRMLDAVQTIPVVERVGIVDTPPLQLGCCNVLTVFADKTTDLRSADAAVKTQIVAISRGYFEASGTTLLMGRLFSWRDDNSAPA